MPYFSVIIPVYNRYHSAKSAIESVLYQNFTDHEVIVVDDGSSDSTPLLAEEYGKSIRYVRQEHSGVSAARNRGIAMSGSEHVAFLDSDDTWQNNKLSSHKQYIETNPGVLIHQTEETWMRNSKRVNPKIIHRKRSGKIFIDSLALCLISPSASVLHRSLFDLYGLFDEALPACEDYDLWLRITPFEDVGLIQRELITRNAGHPDQLSAIHPAMDRFRVYAIIKLLCSRQHQLPKMYAEAARSTAMGKCSILLNGAIKRNNHVFAENIRGVIRQIRDGDCSSKDYLNLAKSEDYL